MYEISEDPINEIFVGLIAPIGTDKEKFIKEFESELNSEDQNSELIVINIFEKSNQNRKKDNEDNSPLHLFNVRKQPGIPEIPKIFLYFLKMEFCNKIRESALGKDALAKLVVNVISNKRKRITIDKKNIIYLIDQLKHTCEMDLLNSVYDSNYVQISCFSNESYREKNLQKKAHNDLCNYPLLLSGNTPLSSFFEINPNIKMSENAKSIINEILENNIEEYVQDFIKQIEADNVSLLMMKDMKDTPDKNDSGQEIYKIYHESHYFVNIDSPRDSIQTTVSKFIKLLYGRFDGYPTVDEFGMATAYVSSMRSNYPQDRQVGASILTADGETLALGNIRVPKKTAIPTKQDTEKVSTMFFEIKEKIKNIKEELDKFKIKEQLKKDILTFIADSLDYHPCTHAEISAIADAAKLGISIEDAILYTTTYPCHLCLRDIITSGISRIVYIEHYPKSKVDILFDKLMEADNWDIDAFEGVGPKRFIYVYNSRFSNKSDSRKFIINKRSPSFYKSAEDKVVSSI